MAALGGKLKFAALWTKGSCAQEAGFAKLGVSFRLPDQPGSLRTFMTFVAKGQCQTNAAEKHQTGSSQRIDMTATLPPW